MVILAFRIIAKGMSLKDALKIISSTLYALTSEQIYASAQIVVKYYHNLSHFH